jgi:hypothetical protein
VGGGVGGGGMGPLLPGSSLPRARCDQGEGSTEDEGEGKERGEAARTGGEAAGVAVRGTTQKELVPVRLPARRLELLI